MDMNIILKSLEDIVSDGFARYSKYIIQDRAIPDARDGLKPVQRRILYAMLKEGNTFDKPHRKSAKAVGTIIGNYHPHGDLSIYDAMVRLSQDFKMNHPLVDMHGNNGSIDGDPPAAMRYTEARLSEIAMYLLENVDKNTVPFAPNFDDTELEPVVLPAYFPNLLVNGSTGISAGYATDIPSHNLAEVIDACVLRLNNPVCDLDDILKIVKGPDFCTGGIIQGKDELKKAYTTGKGRIVIRSKVEVEEKKNMKIIKVSELPYEVNKADLIRKLEEIKYDKVIDGIISIRDESDRHGLSIIIELKVGTDENLVLNYLYKNTNLQVYYSFNMVAIVNKTPMQLGIIPLIDAYLEHQKDVLINKSNYELDLSNKRLHIVEGLMSAVDIIDDIIQIIRESKNRSDSITNLMDAFNFSIEQASAIVDLRLYRLSNTDIVLLEEEQQKLLEYIRKLSLILSDPSVLKKELVDKLISVKEKFKQDRKTKVEEEIEEIVIEKEQLIQDSEVMISVSKDGYVKRSSMKSYQASKDDYVKKEDDFILAISNASTLNKLLLFFDNGLYAYLPVYDLIETRWKDFGKHISNYVSGVDEVKVVSAMLVSDFNINKYLISVSKQGMIKKTSLNDFEMSRYTKTIKYMNIKDDDKVVSCFVNNDDEDIIMISEKGYILRYSSQGINAIGLKSAGIKAMKLSNDNLVDAISCNAFSDEQLYIIFRNGNTKRIPIQNIEIQNRATKGTLYVKAKKNNSDLVLSIFKISSNQNIFVFDNNYDAKLIKAYNTPLSNQHDKLYRVVDKDISLIDACIIEDLLIAGESAVNQNIVDTQTLIDDFKYEFNKDNDQLSMFEEPED